ncbi:MAG: hypothetical protein SVV80_04325 [Planctomycetota bacterium]|nr:hypothetical protein [Planctomycetota bacterium]
MKSILEWMLRLKPGRLSGADSWSPRFAAEYNNWIILGLFVVFSALVALTVVCYLREGDTRRRTKLTIAGIRIAVIVLILALLFQPGLVLRYKKNLYSTVVVLVDDSLSMSLADRYADASLRSALADKLGVNRDELDSLSRTEIVRRILTRQGPPNRNVLRFGEPRKGPLAVLAKDHPLVLLRFSTSQPGSGTEEGRYTRLIGQVEVAGDDPVRQAAASDEIAAAFEGLSSGGYETNLASALRDAADRLEGRRVAGIVLISDGQPTTGSDTGNRLSAARDYIRQRGIPVFSIGVGDPVPPQNVAVVRLQGPTEVRKGSAIEMTAYLSNRNCAGQTVEIRLFRKPVTGDGTTNRNVEAPETWTDTGVSKQVTLAGAAGSTGNETQEVSLVVEKAGDLGEFFYKAEVTPLDREFSDEDNAATTKVRVSEEKIKILFVSGDAGWEFLYLRNLLLRSPDRYALSAWQQNAEAKFNQEASSEKMRLKQLPRTRPELFKYDAVILYDPAYTKEGFDEQFVGMLESFVSDHHGGLCYIASNKHSDVNLTGRGPFKALSDLLPVVLGQRSGHIAAHIARDRPTAWSLIPTPLGLEHSATRLGQRAEENETIWRILPGVYWAHPVLSLKPLASPLAISGDPTDRMSGPDGEATPLIAVQYYGKGRSLYFGFDESWRWLAVDDGMYYRKFWTNVVDFLSAGRLQKKRIIITTGADQFAVGEKMPVRVEAYDKDYKPLDKETLQVDIVETTTGQVQTITLRPDARKKARGHYEAPVTLKDVGVFELTAMRDDPSYKDEVAGKTITVTLPAEEFIHPEAAPVMLETIASEERFMVVHDSDRLIRLIPSGKLTVFNDVPHELWDVPLAIILVVLLLAAELILRKKHNMA